jgi:hypothetical protein
VFIAQCGDEKYAHIAEEERAKVLKECSDAKAWLADKMAQQAALSKDAPLAVLTREIEAKKEMIERCVDDWVFFLSGINGREVCEQLGVLFKWYNGREVCEQLGVLFKRCNDREV